MHSDFQFAHDVSLAKSVLPCRLSERGRLRQLIKLTIIALLCIFFCACSRKSITGPELALRPLSRPPKLSDDLGLNDLQLALRQNIDFISSHNSSKYFRFGKKVYSSTQYQKFLEDLLQIILTSDNEKSAMMAISKSASFYEVYGDKSWSDVLLTSYFEPVLKGSKVKTEQFSRPLYAVPHDLIKVNLARFSAKFDKERSYRGRLEANNLLPYYTRQEIDSQGALSGRKLELCWVDPIDAFFLHIQGSGTIVFEDGSELVLGYGEKNGAEYQAIGKFMKDKISGPITLQAIDKFLRSISSEERDRYLNMNPSYVFFKKADAHAVTQIGISAIAGRTIATDKTFFPKGALGFLVFPKPELTGQSEQLGLAKDTGRFVLDHDIGGAITGPGRVDLFWGRGDEAKFYAGQVKSRAKLYYLGPKDN